MLRKCVLVAFLGMNSLSRIQQRLQLIDGVAELVCTAKFADDLRHVAVL